MFPVTKPTIPLSDVRQPESIFTTKVYDINQNKNGQILDLLNGKIRIHYFDVSLIRNSILFVPNNTDVTDEKIADHDIHIDPNNLNIQTNKGYTMQNISHYWYV